MGYDDPKIAEFAGLAKGLPPNKGFCSFGFSDSAGFTSSGVFCSPTSEGFCYAKIDFVSGTVPDSFDSSYHVSIFYSVIVRSPPLRAPANLNPTDPLGLSSLFALKILN